VTRRLLTDFEALRAQDLLVLRATEGLTDDQARELEGLGGADLETFDLAAAMIDVATSPAEVMPDHVADAVLAAALAARNPASPSTAPALPAIAANLTLRTLSTVPAQPTSRPARAPGSPRSASPRVARFARFVIGGAVAAAAMGAAVTIGRLTAPSSSPVAGRASPPPAAAELPGTVSDGDEPHADEQLAPWTGRDVTGAIRWSATGQRGRVTLHGLPINDPRQARFQIWIIDQDRDPRFPVDGGLFDVTGPDTSVVVQPRVRVTAAREFLITRDAPGGAVVSDRQTIVARAVVP